MSVNKYQDHLQVLVEDDANRQLINGLSLNPSLNARKLDLLPNAGGWSYVLQTLTQQQKMQDMAKYDKRHLLLLIDFDDDFSNRWQQYQQHKNALPANVSDRIYLLGCLHEPEALKAAFSHSKAFEVLGRELSNDCEPQPAENLWQHEHMRHNAVELLRLIGQVKPFLFNE